MTDHSSEKEAVSHSDNRSSSQDSFNMPARMSNDFSINLVFILLVIASPMLLSGDAVDAYLFAWQGAMLLVLGLRYVSGALSAKAENDGNENAFWSSIRTTSIFLIAVGWGVAPLLFLAEASMLDKSVAVLILTCFAGAGLMAYSARLRIAIPYSSLILLPYAVSLFRTGGEEEFLLAAICTSILSLFVLVAERVNFTLNAAQEISEDTEQLIAELSKENHRLHKMLSGYHEKEHLYKEAISQNGMALLKNDHDQEETLISESEPVEKQWDEKETWVLLVDDDPNERRSIEICLRDSGLKYVSVGNVTEALSVLCEFAANGHYFDIALIDMWMPEMDGIGLAECLKDDQEFRYIDTVMMNSGASPSITQLEKASVSSIISKPFMWEELSETIENILQNRVSREIGKVPSLPVIGEEEIIYHTSDYSKKNTVLDKEIFDGFCESQTVDSGELISDFMDKVPRMLQQASQEYSNSNLEMLSKISDEISQRSRALGAIALADKARTLQVSADSGIQSGILFKLHEVETEFVHLETELVENSRFEFKVV